MRKAGSTEQSHLEKTVLEILKSKAQSKIYLFLLNCKEAKTDDIIKGTHLHPSTVREALVKMHKEQLLIRRKLKNDAIGKNPFLYSPIPPFQLFRKYAAEIEHRLNSLALFSLKEHRRQRLNPIKITISDEEDSL